MTSRLAGPAFATLALLLCGAAAHADTTIYKCVDADGRIEFTDINKRNCKVLEGLGQIPAPPQHRSAAPARAAAPAVVPADFPKVNTSQQKARDDDRRGILTDELRDEEKKLAELRRDFNNGEPERQGGERNYAKYQERVAQMKDNIGRAEKNIDALKREIANIR
ncbi:DUF4124 domain-containing protein [Massilia sp. R2A-15]|uniref:DUF4124 domain-containing protein n=1 Tax=Massilia sp. R2A-15 TaxID=3064278 RepID=UPI0027366987|nr:DUF4124 domain-containing protein [Massilia sp. R2A-15]WLI89973.1 DUF4124 domain-containing protein [Massilia sp. R2A-15]